MEEILNSTEEKMMLTIESLENKFTNVRAGRANPNMLDGIMVEYYGVPTPLKSLANISIPEARQLSIKPFDRSCLGAIEKAIFEANLGVTPNNNGEVVFIVIPPLTEDRRKELYSKLLQNTATESEIIESVKSFKKYEKLWSILPILKKNFKMCVVNNRPKVTYEYWDKYNSIFLN